ncbi:FGGY family carbohydrate kinase [Planococcus sp. ISL-109]|uniref:gluconokinase n=1 Tax=Planococcus sp. ISL-109 TaxID=2819166 RepID=UPI001BEABD58|nr:FGGY family carbohydrate kinase [Planococcus sp. ISL-109]MBT2583297.1 gluconate kinase [Planococcus sp. ISL-109]
MNRPIAYLGVDVGTSSTKAVIYGAGGQLLSQAHRSYPLDTPNPFTAEVDPPKIFHALMETIQEAVEKAGDVELRFLSFSAAMHSVIAVDEHGDLLTKCITWADTRSQKAAAEIRSAHGGLYRKTGTPIHAMSPLTKILWLKQDQPDLFDKTAKFIDLKSYLLHRLFGVWLIDESLASATGLFNPLTRDWEEQALEIVGITRDQLPHIVPVTHSLTGMDLRLAEAMGIPVGTCVIVGGSDGALSNIGLGAARKGTLAVTIGTSGAVRTITNQPVLDPLGRTFCYAISPHQFLVGGPVNNGGLVLGWLIDVFGDSDTSYEQLVELARPVPPGADGLLFHPYLTGERAPLWNASARGSYFGLSIHHTKAHLIRAALEGVLFNLHEVLLTVELLTGKTNHIQASGGFSRSPIWRQMLADIVGVPVNFPKQIESGCLGAVLLGRYAMGELQELGESDWPEAEVYRHEPDAAAAKVYRELMTIYLGAGRLLQEGYAEIDEFQRRHATDQDDAIDG